MSNVLKTTILFTFDFKVKQVNHDHNATLQDDEVVAILGKNDVFGDAFWKETDTGQVH